MQQPTYLKFYLSTAAIYSKATHNKTVKLLLAWKDTVQITRCPEGKCLMGINPIIIMLQEASTTISKDILNLFKYYKLKLIKHILVIRYKMKCNTTFCPVQFFISVMNTFIYYYYFFADPNFCKWLLRLALCLISLVYISWMGI